MKISSLRWDVANGWKSAPQGLGHRVDLILYFAATEVMDGPNAPWKELVKLYPEALCVGCTSAGEILNGSVGDDGLSAVAVQFSSTCVKAELAVVSSANDSFQVGADLARRLIGPELRHVLVLSDGLSVNGSQLVAGLRSSLPEGVCASGGLAGDGARFAKTLVGLGEEVGTGRVVAVGFYGEKLAVSHGSAGGWQPFGPTRLITKADKNVLYTLDDQPALELYKKYLGDLAQGLPATGLLFPLELLSDRAASRGVVRTILAVDEATQSLTFAGDVPVGHYCRLMKASCDALVTGAETAANQTESGDGADRLAILVSCVGRKLVMKQRVEEEVEAVLSSLGKGVSAAGFYSYGEICPSGLVRGCDFHNQTMTMTVFAET